MNIGTRGRLEWLTLAMLAAVLAWDASGLDLWAAQLFGGPAGFSLKDHWLFEGVLHTGGRWVSWMLAAWVVIGIWRPTGCLHRIDIAERIQLALSLAVAVLLISGMKKFSNTSCPAELEVFGRTARYVSHWAWFGASDGGTGRCFPAGHASAAFAFVGGYFAFVKRSPETARLWLATAVLSGIALGVAQQVRGAHFMSHTLWTAWLCWASALAIDRARALCFRMGRVPAVRT
ncbi:phosphatase PAP2 family protein [soil metagenome]